MFRGSTTHPWSGWSNNGKRYRGDTYIFWKLWAWTLFFHYLNFKIANFENFKISRAVLRSWFALSLDFWTMLKYWPAWITKKRADISRKSADMRKKVNKEQQLPFDKEKMHRRQAGLYSASQCCIRLAMNFYLEDRNTVKRRVKLCFVPVLLLFSNLQLLGFSNFFAHISAFWTNMLLD